MDIAQEHRERIDQIVAKMTTPCPKDLVCYKSGFEVLPNTKVIGRGDLVECFEENRQSCRYGLSFGQGTFCKCPIRNYIARNFLM